eukprot:CAMPEP_0197583738 /NCGR_PEP_ID=MMETSP1326-20131121/6558_1 /TAXON_ID=1155430 /ORGANISM="Genus nov. species nov., Strain RCC2288" /LENGTH=450 /DNA_ID=CAMNT_0043147999 /DNA_START=35 /DNA_END=1387 /DNA_ORIENTATION=+
MAATAANSSFLTGSAALGAPGAASRRRSARRAGVVTARASSDEQQVSASPLASIANAARNFGVALVASAVIASPSAALSPYANPVFSDLAGLEANPVTNARSLLRNALPVKNKEMREVQKRLESISDDLRVPGVRFTGVESSVNAATKILANDSAKIVAAIAPSKLADGKAALEQLKLELVDFKVIVEQKDKQEVPLAQQKTLALVGRILEDMVDGFPFQVPAPYDTAPLLKGRATVEVDVKIKDNNQVETGVMTLIIDGYNAPVTAGNFIDLVERGFYNNMEIQRSDGFVVQTGKPMGPKGGPDGFIDPVTGKERTVPLEIMTTKSKDGVPVYDLTLEEMGMYRDEPILPFNAFGTMAMARRESEDNSASSQFFFLLRESELTPAGTNILDGRYSVFGYVVEGQDVLRELKAGDIIKSAKVVSGIENLTNVTRTVVNAPAMEEDASVAQ